MMKKVLVVVGIAVLIGVAFWGGAVYGSRSGGDPAAAGAMARDGMPPDGSGMGGPMADLTEEQIAEMEGMTQEERMAYLQEELGVEAPQGAAGMGGPGGARGGTLEGEVLDMSSDSLTVSIENGSQTVYLDEDTVIALVEGAPELTAGSNVIIIAEPAADGVSLAGVVVVK